jgi:phosphoglycerate dehydrogenase-like enzyme
VTRLTETRAARVAIAPKEVAWAIAAVEAGGGKSTPLADNPNALVWTDFSARRVGELAEVLEAHPSLEWVQLPVAGVERVFDAGVFDATRVWTSAKGLYAEPVAEHALALALACLRHLPERVQATSWGS